MNDIVVRRLVAALPALRAWIDQYLQRHARAAQTVHSLGSERLSVCYPQPLLEATSFIVVDRVELPPLASFGLPELAPLQGMVLDGLTLNSTYLVARTRVSESLHFHELVHVMQWRRLGTDRFLLAYALGFLRFGYEESPLEKMAYSLQHEFDAGICRQQLVRDIETSTDSCWNDTAALVLGRRLPERNTS